MRQSFNLEKPTEKGFVHAGALQTIDLEPVSKDVLPDRGGWTFEIPVGVPIAVGWRIRLKAGKPWYVQSVVSSGDGKVTVTLAGQP